MTAGYPGQLGLPRWFREENANKRVYGKVDIASLMVDEDSKEVVIGAAGANSVAW